MSIIVTGQKAELKNGERKDIQMPMKYAIISDVHGNLTALLEVLRGIPDKKIIRGNEERYLERLIGKDQSTWTDGQMQISYWNYRNISKDNLETMLSWPERLDFEENGVKIHAAHSSDSFLGEYEFAKFGPGFLRLTAGCD